MPALVFDLGGTHLRAAVAQRDGSLNHIVKQRIGNSVDGLAPAAVWHSVLSSMSNYIDQHGRKLDGQDPIVLSVAGPIDESGRIVSAPTLIGSNDEIPDVRDRLEAMAHRPVHMLNDLSAAAWYLGSSTVRGRFLVVTVSSGIGSKIFDPAIGSLDDIPFGGEIGHSIVDESVDAPCCDCGGKGHLGAIASGRGIERMARQRALAEPNSFARSECAAHFGATPCTLRNEDHLVPALRNGDPWTVELVRHCSRYLARVLVSSVLVAGLRSVVIIGGFALAAGEPYLRILREAVCELCDYNLLRDSIAARLTLGAVGEETCLLGAACYARSIART